MFGSITSPGCQTRVNRVESTSLNPCHLRVQRSQRATICRGNLHMSDETLRRRLSEIVSSLAGQPKQSGSPRPAKTGTPPKRKPRSAESMNAQTVIAERIEKAIEKDGLDEAERVIH